jgi:hypothetical protein
VLTIKDVPSIDNTWRRLPASAPAYRQVTKPGNFSLFRLIDGHERRGGRMKHERSPVSTTDNRKDILTLTNVIDHVNKTCGHVYNFIRSCTSLL